MSEEADPDADIKKQHFPQPAEIQQGLLESNPELHAVRAQPEHITRNAMIEWLP